MLRFRGLIASASLKLGSAVLVLYQERKIPRLDCLGLIEATGARRGLPRTPKRFRGLIASASLKRRQQGFPSRTGLQIPRLDCLGLIEAGLSASNHESECR